MTALQRSDEEKFDVVVVSFAHEFSSLVLQARSIAKTNFHSRISTYRIVWNDVHEREVFQDKFLPRITRELASTAVKVDFALRSEFISEDLVQTSKGSRLQQVLKLLAVADCGSVYCCVLDTKNHAVRNCEFNDFLCEANIMRSHPQNYGPTSLFGVALKSSLAYFNLGEKFNLNRALPSTTPYMMRPDLVAGMIKDIEIREKKEFSSAFLTNKELLETTEFLLYYAFLLYKFGGIDELYCLKERIYVTFFNSSPKTDDAIRQEIARMQEAEIKFLGLHRGRKMRMSSEEKEAFIELWLSSSLFVDRAAAVDFIENGSI